MTVAAPLRSTSPALPGPYAELPPRSPTPTPAVLDLVAAHVRALLDSSPAYYALDAGRRARIERDLTKIAGYAAALVQEEFAQAERLGQRPVRRVPVAPAAPLAARGALARAANDPPPPRPADEFDTRAVGDVAAITKDTLNAVAFPTFVSDLINGTFNAIVQASIQQMEAFGTLLANVAKTVDQFMADNITDNQAKDWLVAKYPNHLRLDTADGEPSVRVRDDVDDREPPNLRADLGLDQDVDLSDDSIESALIPAARRSLARQRHQLLSTMVLMGINRIVVTSGRIRARMDFHIDASDQARADSATKFENRNTTVAGGGFLGFGVVSANSLAYVSTKSRSASDEINMSVDLMGEVDLKFKSETFPLERFAEPHMVALIQGGTANPAANPPTGLTPGNEQGGAQ